MDKAKILKLLKENYINIDVDKEIEAMRKLGCLYFSICNIYGDARLTIDLRK